MPTTQKLVRFSSDTDKALYEKALRSVDFAVRSYVWYLDLEGHIKHCNQQADSLASLERTRGMNFAEAIGLPASAEQWQPELQKIIKSGIGVFGARETVVVAGQPRQFSVDKIPTLDRWGGVSGLLLVVNDITEEAARENALQESESRYRAFIATTTDAVWCYEVSPPVDTGLPLEEQVAQIAAGARLVECNQYYAELYGAENPEALLGARMSSTTISNFMGKLRLFIEAGYQLADKETVRELEQGGLEYWQITALGTVDDEGFLQRIWGTSKNITDRRRFLEKLHHQATHDALTELPNRTLLHQQIQQAIEERQGKAQMALLIIDLDRFKEINDTLGHHAGDRLLRQLGPRLAEEMQNLPGIIARLGGDEFAIFLSSIADAEQAAEVARRILAAIRQPFIIEGFHTEISASIGIALCPDQASDVSTLMRYADVAMYRAKRDMLGVSIYQSEQDPHSPKRLALMGELGKAIRENQLLLHYQPKVRIGSDEVQGFEALLRWMHPTMGLIAPDDFIPLAESTGIIRPLTEWVLSEAIAQCKVWMDRGVHVAVAVNLSSRSLLDREIVSTIADALAAHRLPASMLELEITESAMMVDPPRALKVLQEIHELGVNLSIDDFGTGYSSLSYLKKLPVKTLKVDYSFVVNMLEDEQDRIIVNSIVNLAHNLGLQVVAEGVENASTLAALEEINCDIAQGYHLLHPQVASDAELWFRRREDEKKLALAFDI